MGGETGDGRPGSPSSSTLNCTRFSLLMGTAESSTPRNSLHPSPNFLPSSFLYFPQICRGKKRKVRRPIWPTIDSMQVAVTLPGSETTIVSR